MPENWKKVGYGCLIGNEAEHGGSDSKHLFNQLRRHGDFDSTFLFSQRKPSPPLPADPMPLVTNSRGILLFIRPSQRISTASPSISLRV